MFCGLASYIGEELLPDGWFDSAEDAMAETVSACADAYFDAMTVAQKEGDCKAEQAAFMMASHFLDLSEKLGFEDLGWA